MAWALIIDLSVCAILAVLPEAPAPAADSIAPRFHEQTRHVVVYRVANRPIGDVVYRYVPALMNCSWYSVLAISCALLSATVEKR